MNKTEVLELTKGVVDVVGLDKYVTAKANEKNVSDSAKLKYIIDYIAYLDSKPILSDFLGSTAIYEGFEFFRLNKKIYFRIDIPRENNKKDQHLFSYCEETNKFIGRTQMKHFTDIGLKIKR